MNQNNTSHLVFNPVALRTAKTLWSFGHFECNRFKGVPATELKLEGKHFLVLFHIINFCIMPEIGQCCFTHTDFKICCVITFKLTAPPPPLPHAISGTVKFKKSRDTILKLSSNHKMKQFAFTMQQCVQKENSVQPDQTAPAEQHSNGPLFLLAYIFPERRSV